MGKRLKPDTIEQFLMMVEREFDEYKRFCEHPEDVELEFEIERITLIHCGKPIKHWDNPFPNNPIFE